MLESGASIPQMNEAERRRISGYIEEEFGIKMPAAKKSLLEGRLAKRLRACGVRSYGEYFDLVTDRAEGRDEYLHFADLVSTHETSFFREPKHFHFLEKTILPALCSEPQRRSLSVLSAACSTGEEAWTLAMLLDAAVANSRRVDLDYGVEGVDLSAKAVDIASRAVYPVERTRSIPMALRQRYIMVSRDRHRQLCRFVPELRSTVSFHSGNLLSQLALERRHYDIVFCRNVLIYFDAAHQRQAIAALLAHMAAGAYLFLGHSETMHSSGFAMRNLAHAVYQKL